jgi:hypothetical protein
MITLEQAKKLQYGQILEHVSLKNADKTSLRLKVTGKVKLWKRDSNRIAIPLKYGLYEYGYLTNGTQEGNGFLLGLHQVNL